MSSFRVGQRVCCIRANDGDNLVLRAIYTIKSIDQGRGLTMMGEIVDYGLTLEETLPPAGYEGFDPSRFRPVVERKTDIGVFQAFLVPSKIGELA